MNGLYSVKKTRYKIQAIRSACSKVHRSKISWWAKNVHKLFGWLGSREGAGLGLPGSWDLTQQIWGPIAVQGGLASESPSGGGRILNKQNKDLVFFWVAYLVIQIQ